MQGVGRLRQSDKLVTTSIRLICSALLLVFTVALVPAQSKPSDSIPTVTFCDLARQPATYANKRVRVRAIYRVGFEWQEIYSVRCIEAPSTWLEFSDDIDEGPSRKELKKMNLDNRFSISVGVVLEGRLTFDAFITYPVKEAEDETFWFVTFRSRLCDSGYFRTKTRAGFWAPTTAHYQDSDAIAVLQLSLS